MRNLIFALLVSSLVISCSSTDKTAEKNLLLVEKYVKGVENMDYEIMDDLLADNYLGLGPSFGDSINKVQAIESWKQNVENLYEKIEYFRSRNNAVTITTGDNQGEWVSNWAELKITYKGDKGSVMIWSNSIYLIENNKIIKSYTFYNEADALRQLGYVFINPDHL
ncbi:MAG: hypothetical protein DRJ10_17355 [Bacteroidetes bacterium]|nr:MAG: hypothetical protein DRJ10_17355 [Bacteroidota bacterium]